MDINPATEKELSDIYDFASPNDASPKSLIQVKGDISIRKSTADDRLSLTSLRADSSEISFTDNYLTQLDLDNVHAHRIWFSDNYIRMANFTNCTFKEFSINGDSLGKVPTKHADQFKKYWKAVQAVIEQKDAEFSKRNVFAEMLALVPSTDSVFDIYSLSFEKNELGSLSLSGIESKFLSADFVNCSITGDFNYSDPMPEIEDNNDDEEDFDWEMAIRLVLSQDTITKREGFANMTFANSLINGKITNLRQGRFLEYQFEKCVFGKDADLTELNFDRLVIANCSKIETDLYLKIPSTVKAEISIINSNLDRIHFDYTENLVFVPDPLGGETKDQIRSAYTTLLAKFRTEGKAESFRKLDIEYKQWDYGQQGAWGKFVNALDRYWWYYGYRKHYILYWSLALLLMFAVFNFFAWKSLKSIYPAVGSEPATYYEKMDKRKYRQAKSVHVIIATFFIFFSFRVDFNKIDYRNTRMLFFFFLQYVIGVICLFFIINFILKT